MTDTIQIVNPEAEAAIIGACLADADAVIFVAPEVQPADFSVPIMRNLAGAIWECFAGKIPPTMGAVIDRLRAAGKWSDTPSRASVTIQDIDACLSAITQADVDHAISNARLVRECAFRRSGYSEVSGAAKLFNDRTLTTLDIQRGVMNRVGHVFDGYGKRDSALGVIGQEERNRIAAMSDTDLPGVSCGIAWLDDLTGGFLPAEAWVIAAPYKMRKCVVGNTRIITHNGMVRIDDVCRGFSDGFTDAQLDVFGIQGWDKTSHFYVASESETIRVSTIKGFEIEGTPEHPVLVAGDGAVTWKRLSELAETDYIAIERQLPEFGNDHLPDAPTTLTGKNPFVRFPETMSGDLARFLGYIVAEGTVSGVNRVSFTNTDDEITTDFVLLCHNLFGITPKQYGIDYHLSNVDVRRWLDLCGIHKGIAKDKNVPDVIWSASRQNVAQFLKAFFSCDGWVGSNSITNARSVEFTSASDELVRDIQIVLLRFGIVSSRGKSFNKKYQRHYYTLHITGDNAILYYNEIGFLLKHKSDKLAERANLNSPGRRRTSDPIIGMRKTMTEILDSVPAKSRPGVLPLFDGRRLGDARNVEITYPRATEIINRLTGIVSEYTLLPLAQMVNHRYFFDKVKTLQTGKAKTFDLTLPVRHSFFSNGLVSHNTTLALNMVLSVASANVPVSVFTVGDSSRDSTYRKLLAMQMNKLMIVDGEMTRQVVSSKALQYKMRDTYYIELRQRAEAVLDVYPARLYDGRDMVSNLNETGRILRRDMAMYGTRVFVYDYAQAANCGQNDYERTSYIAGWTQQLIGESGITGIIISQLNEATIKVFGDNESYSPGAKGGGALPAMSNVFLSTRYAEPLMTVELKLARDTRMGDKMIHHLNPPSGLILDAIPVKGA